MEQVNRIMKMAEENKENLKREFKNYTLAIEAHDGKNQVVLITEKAERFVLHFVINKAGLNLIAMPEGQELGLEATQLERSLLETATHQAIHVFNRKFSQRTGWELVDLGAVFAKGPSRIFLTYEEGEISITDAEFEYLDEDE